MIKALLDPREPDGRHHVLLGLSRANLERLLDDQPIVVDLAAPAPYGLEIEGGSVVVIMGGETEADIRGKLMPLIGPGTKEVLNEREAAE
jgi:hypothetical protein